VAGRLILGETTPRRWAEALARLKKTRPLVYTITNFVSAPLQAAGTAAIGASPVMSRCPREAGELAEAASSLVVNTGTPDDEGIRAMETALPAGKNIVFDPVGYGASLSRRTLVDRLLPMCSPAVIKGNYGETGMLAGGERAVRGVDSTAKAPPEPSRMGALAQKWGTLVCATGETDIFCDGLTALSVSGGSRYMGKISGGGCLLGSLMGALIPEDTASGAVAASVLLRVAGERAERKASGPGSFIVCLLDELAEVTPEDLAGQGERVRKIWEVNQ
jgi:hydroxyethylthiazole kinase